VLIIREINFYVTPV